MWSFYVMKMYFFVVYMWKICGFARGSDLKVVVLREFNIIYYSLWCYAVTLIVQIRLQRVQVTSFRLFPLPRICENATGFVETSFRSVQKRQKYRGKKINLPPKILWQQTKRERAYIFESESSETREGREATFLLFRNIDTTVALQEVCRVR